MKRTIKKISRMLTVAMAAFLIVSSCSVPSSLPPSVEDQEVQETRLGSEVEVNSEVADYRSFWAAPSQISLHWNNNQDEPYGQLESLRQDLEGQGKTVKLLTNAGIFLPGFIPAGLHVEQGSEFRPISLIDGGGNFQLLPNGVFYIEDGVAGVLESNAYAASGIEPRLATQSGPQLLIDGAIHPEFSETSESTNIRNGVGIMPDGQVLFLISTKPVNLWDFASEFLDYGVTNALYLDGTISAMDEPADDVPLFPNIPFAGMLAVTE